MKNLIKAIAILTHFIPIIALFSPLFNASWLIYVGGVFCVFELISGLATGELKSIHTIIIAIVGAIIIVKGDIFYRICVGLCIESIFMLVSSLIFMLMFQKKMKE